MPLARLLFPIALALLLRPAFSAGTYGACSSSNDCDSGLSCSSEITSGIQDRACTNIPFSCICYPKDDHFTFCLGSDDSCRISETCFSEVSGLDEGLYPAICLDKEYVSLLIDGEPCNETKKCPSGKICYDAGLGYGLCYDENVKPPTTQPTTTTPTCVAVQSLLGVAGHMLVRQKHAMARVLCDGNWSCATKGHMVEFRGRAMMMESYCALVGCNEEVMLVNSPRYTRGARYESHTKGLLWTPFAARYGSRVEEHLLRTAIHSGL